MRPTRKERERQAHRRAMLDAAERVFVRKGYYQATVEEIAQEAEFSVGTLYNFFKGKEDLYGQVVDKIAREFLADFEARVLTRADPEAAIGALIELRLTHFEDHRGFFRVFFETSPGSRLDPARALPEGCVGLYDHYVEQVTDLFRRGVDAGRFAPFDPFYLTLCLEGIINAFAAYWSRREPAEPLPTRIAKMKASFIERLKVRPPEVEASPPEATDSSARSAVQGAGDERT